MFCTTFYSFKGGVGRTLALANVAVELARSGRKVLVVDFDLEAPGLATLAPFSEASSKSGIIDMVGAYIASGQTPPLSDYVHRCPIPLTRDEYEHGFAFRGALDIIPAGRDDDGLYAQRLANIDWSLLYDAHEGFLFMEDLRLRWEEAGYDYVLIDSRTGHTDVGGICTRQLPDAVVALFFPNEQNLVGLKQVVNGVRHNGARPDPIDLIFVASRVPRLDDEHGYLRDRLERFKDELNYDEDDLVVIEHYDSLMLLNQALFVVSRQSSGLAVQYRSLATRIMRVNDEDPVGAFHFAREMASPRTARRFDRNGRDNGALQRLSRIAEVHHDDQMIQYYCARAYYSLRELTLAVEAIDNALRTPFQTKTNVEQVGDFAATAHRLRLRILKEINENTEGEASANAILSDENAPNAALIDALLAKVSTSGGQAIPLDEMPALTGASPRSLLDIAQKLRASPSAVLVAADLTALALADLPNDETEDLSGAQFVLVAGKRFAEALEYAERITRTEPPLVRAFNTAMALWGRDGQPDQAAFEQVIDLYGATVGQAEHANLLQCLGLSFAALGRAPEMQEALKKARTTIRAQQGRDVSCWTYFMSTPEEFERDIEAILAFAIADGPPPTVLTPR